MDSKSTEISQGNLYKNPNIKVENIKTKRIEFNKDILFIQHAYQLSIIKIIGMIMYKSPDEYTENIGFKEKLLLVTKKENNKDDLKEKNENKNLKVIKRDSLFNNIFYPEIDLSALNNSINNAIIENAEEYNNLMDGNINIDAESLRNKNNNYQNSSEGQQLFEMMKEDDMNYHILDDYKEDDGSESDY